jgi:hypothetical protein
MPSTSQVPYPPNPFPNRTSDNANIPGSLKTVRDTGQDVELDLYVCIGQPLRELRALIPEEVESAYVDIRCR